MVWPKVIPLSGAYCSNFWSLHCIALWILLNVINLSWKYLVFSGPERVFRHFRFPRRDFLSGPSTRDRRQPRVRVRWKSPRNLCPKSSQKFDKKSERKFLRKTRLRRTFQQSEVIFLGASLIWQKARPRRPKFIISDHITYNLRCEMKIKVIEWN